MHPPGIVGGDDEVLHLPVPLAEGAHAGVHKELQGLIEFVALHGVKLVTGLPPNKAGVGIEEYEVPAPGALEPLQAGHCPPALAQATLMIMSP